MKRAWYFERNVLENPLRSYIKLEWCERAVRNPEATEVQENGRIRHWTHIPELGKYLRVITLADGETLFNAFEDRNFTKKAQKREGDDDEA